MSPVVVEAEVDINRPRAWRPGEEVTEMARKAGFIPEFDKVVTEVTPEAELSFLRRPAPAGPAGMISRSC